MSLSPIGGIPSVTRSGDLDPEVVLRLVDDLGGSTVAVRDVVSQHAGVVGVAGRRLDTPSLLALDEPYILDVAVSAVLAVAVLENEICAREMVEFEPPPTTTITAHTAESGLKVASGSVGRKAKRVEKKKRALESGKERGLVRETVGLVGLGVKGAVWLMGAGLKAARASAR